MNETESKIVWHIACGREQNALRFSIYNITCCNL